HASERPHALSPLRPRAPRDHRPRRSGVRAPRPDCARWPRPARVDVQRALRGTRALGRERGSARARPRRPLGELPRTAMSDHDDDHHHPAPLSPVEARARALEEILVEKGIVQPDVVDAIVTLYENDIGPMNGARVVARAWIDPTYRARLLAD